MKNFGNKINPWNKDGYFGLTSSLANNVLEKSNVLKNKDVFYNNNNFRGEKYISYLVEGANKLKQVEFGSTVGQTSGIVDPFDKYDKDFWYESINISMHFTDLVLKENKIPSEAILAIFDSNNIYKWALDCSRFVDLLHIYANLRTRQANNFDRIYGKEKIGDFYFRPHDSSASEVFVDYFKKSKSEYFIKNNLYEENKYSENELLDLSPSGSVVIFCNEKATSETWQHENTIKISNNLFIAHGFGQKKFFLKNEILENLARSEDNSLSGNRLIEYISSNLYIKQILWINQFVKF